MAFKCDQKEYTMIPLWTIRFDESVADMVEQQGCIFPPTLLSNIYDAGTYKLDQRRLDRILSGYNSGLPAISVEKGLGGKYTLLNGRHRICATVLNGGMTIPASEIVTANLDLGLEIVKEWEVDKPTSDGGIYEDDMVYLESHFRIESAGK